MRRLAALAIAIVVLALFGAREARACGNATLRDEPAYVALRDAEEALEEGDIVRARELAMPVADGKVRPRFLPEQASARGKRVVALSWVRDPASSADRVDAAIFALAKTSEESPRDDSALGEAFARAGMNREAYDTLEPLAKKDLIGSAYAYAALARVAGQRGDAETSALAKKRCSEITSSAAICRGEYPPPPFLRGKVLGYALPGVLAVFALLRRRRSKAPWSTHGDKLAAAAILASCAAVFALARQPWAATLATATVFFVVARVQRVVFVRAVKRGAVPGFALRDRAPEDGALPIVRSIFQSGECVLERTPDAGYREPARVGVLRLAPRRRAPLVLAMAGFLTLALFGACTFATRSLSKSASVSIE